MSDEASERPSSRVLWTTWLVALMLVYLLLPGLFAFWEQRRGYRAPEWLERPLRVIYAPLRAAMRVKPINDAYSAYMGWCAGHPVYLPATPP